MIRASLVAILGALIVFSVIQREQNDALSVLAFWIVVAAAIWLISRFSLKRR